MQNKMNKIVYVSYLTGR